MIKRLRLAGGDELTSDQYREIYDELRGNRSLREFCALVGEPENRIAWWSKYHRNLCVLGHHERNILRHAVGVAELSATVTEVTAAADAGASVWFIGDEGEIAKCVVLLGEIDPVTIRATNGDLEVKFDHLSERPAESNVTPVTRKKAYVPVWRPKLPVEWRDELAALGLDLREIIREALAK